MNNKLPAYLYEKNNIIWLIFSTALFALLFINIFQPFGSRNWYPYISDLKYFIFSSLIIITGMLVVVISRYIMYQFSKKHVVLYWHYYAWIFTEILAMSIFFTCFSKFIPAEGQFRDITAIFRQAFINTSLILLLPYAICWLFLSWREKNNLLLKIEQQIKSTVPSKQTTGKNDASKDNYECEQKLINFEDEHGKIKLSVMLDNILYIESLDNYINVHYFNKSKLSHYLFRNTLKWLDEHWTRNTPLIRCHRSFMVNLEKVKVIRKTKEGIFIEFDAENTPDIPVSKKYYEQVMEKLKQFTN